VKRTGNRAIGKLERLAYERQLRDLRDPPRYLDEAGVEQRYRFSWATGNRAVQFIEKFCCHSKGEWAGQKIKLEKWQKRIARIAFGWLRTDGNRRFRTSYAEIARKNAKSTMAGGLGLFLLLADDEKGAEIYSAATKKDQAKIVWDTAAAMVRASPALSRFLKVFKTGIVVERTGSSFKPLGADSDTLDGLNPHGLVIDELHAHKTRGLWDVLASAMGARRQPMTIAITTAGHYDPTSIGWEIHDYAVKVLEQQFPDETFFAFIACADPADDPFSDEALQKANPNWGVSVKPDYLRKQAEQAKRKPGFLPEYEAKHINIWSQQAKRWLPMDRWQLSDPQPPAGVDVRALAVAREKQLVGLTCRAGLDLSSKLDLSALVLEFQQGDAVELVCRFWLPDAEVKRQSERGRRHYEGWAREGWITVTPGDVVDYAFIRKEINELSKLYKVAEIGFDPYGATQLVTELREADGIPMVEIRQNYLGMSAGSKDVEAKVVAQQVRHMNNPVLRWCAANCIVTTDHAGNIHPDKANSQGKIDGVVAWIMARARNSLSVAKTSVYESRGFRQL
jgi:phage terminase large subunit-like protein